MNSMYIEFVLLPFPKFFFCPFLFCKFFLGTEASKRHLTLAVLIRLHSSFSHALIKLALTELNGRGSEAIRHAIRQTAALWFAQKTDACSFSVSDLALAWSLVGMRRLWYFQNVRKNKRALKRDQPISSSRVKALWKWCLAGLRWWLDRLPYNTHNKHTRICMAVHVPVLSDAGTYYCIHTVYVMPIDLSVESL